MDSESIDTEKIKDIVLNVLLIASVLLGVFFMAKPNQSSNVQAPLNSHYNVTKLSSLDVNELPQYSKAVPIPDDTMNQPSVASGVDSAPTGHTPEDAGTSENNSGNTPAVFSHTGSAKPTLPLSQKLRNLIGVDTRLLRLF